MDDSFENNQNVDFPESFLSLPLISLLCARETCRADLIAAEYSIGYVTPSLTYNWDSIEPLVGKITGLVRENSGLEPCSDEAEPSQLPSEAFERLWPIFHQAEQVLRTFDAPLVHLSSWRNCCNFLSQCIKEMKNEEDNIVPLKSLLLLSSIFERALGDAFLIHGQCVPFLLKDLLKSEELIQIFGRTPMKMAQILFGMPHGFNIRNVCWHGFPSPDEIHRDIAAGVIVLVCSFAEILSSKHLPMFPYRPLVSGTDWESPVKALISCKFPMLIGTYSEISKVIHTCSVISKTHKKYWLTAVGYINSRRFGESLLFLLPALEHLLRCLFCMANKCPKHMYLAEQHTFYITMDEILSQNFVNSDGKESMNAIRALLGDHILEMLLDIFHYSAGPRIRDRMSHGEYDLNEVPEIVPNHLLCVSLIIFGKFCDISFLKYGADLANAHLSYISKFHPVSLLLKKLQTIKLELQKLKLCYQNAGSLGFQCEEVSHLELMLLNLSSSTQCKSITCTIEDYLKKSLSMLYRSKSDMTVITSLLKISLTVELTVKNCRAMIEERTLLLENHKLRSRQRQAHHRMLECVPSFHSISNCLILIILMQLYSLPQHLISSRCTKAINKFYEKMASLSSLRKNRWQEIKMLTVEISCELQSDLRINNHCRAE